ncbi:MAG TPA: AI-2E family transporter [Candidatus Paceibacterota bacterium]
MSKSIQAHYFLIILIVGAGVLVFYILAPFMAPLALGIIFAVLLQPFYRRLVVWLGGRESIAALLTVAISILVLLIPMIILGAQLVREAQDLYVNIAFGEARSFQEEWLGRVEPWINQYIPSAADPLVHLTENISVYAQQASSWIVRHLGVAFSGISTFFLQTFIFLMTLYYLLRDGERLKRVIIEISPLADTDDEMIFQRLGAAVNSVVKGKLVIALIQGFLSGIGFALFGVPNPVMLGFIAALVSLVPPLGTALILVPAVIYLVVIGAVWPAIGLAIWSVVAVGLIDNVLGPKLMGSGMDLHPLLVLLSVLGGLAFFGPVGLFLGPIAVSFFITLLSLYRHFTAQPQSP